MHFQYISELYEDQSKLSIKHIIEDWLRINIGSEGSAREEQEDFDWAWSLTTEPHGPAPTGIYFKRTEDKMRFRLSFGIGYGRVR